MKINDEDCINSIKQQDYKHWEIIVVDNYSRDKTLSTISITLKLLK